MEKKYEVFMGRLGKEPELKYTPKGQPVCLLSVAVRKGEGDEVDWRNVVVWDRQAEICNIQLRKGSEIFVQGRARRREFTTDLGVRKIYEEINARRVGFTNI